MRVGDLVFMHNLRTIGIIVDEKSVDKETEYQVKWFYTMAPDFTGYRGPGHWYNDFHLGVYSEVSSVP